MRTLEVPIEIEVYEGCATATPVFPRRARQTPRRPARRAASPSVCSAAHAPVPSEMESSEALKFAGALPADIIIIK
jgi:hypothetical protein